MHEKKHFNHLIRNMQFYFEHDYIKRQNKSSKEKSNGNVIRVTKRCVNSINPYLNHIFISSYIRKFYGFDSRLIQSILCSQRMHDS
jgi:hypothetical protein